MKHRRSWVVTVSLLAASVAGFLDPATAPAAALSGSSFRAGNIISDQLFYNSGTMGQPQIQQFLNGHYAGCASGYTCIRDYVVTTQNEVAEANLCTGYTGATNELASLIIAKVSLSCGINPQVLLVLLQKESGLITNVAPSYNAVTGYSCPDSSGCDPAYYGFMNQVYLAARQFKRYRLNPNNYGYVAGRSNNILYNPATSCGSSSVYIENQATAGLYDYTPYQPNAAALNNLSGTGDACSAYGNRNFWTYFNNWFGPTTFVTPALGSAVTCLGATLGATQSVGASTGLLPGLGSAVPIGQSAKARMADLLAVDSNGGLWYYPNTTTGTVATPFTDRSVAASGALPSYLAQAAGDVNGDGRADLVASAPDGTLWLYLGNGTSDPYTSGAVRIGVAGWDAFNWLGLADVNGDGRADLLATTSDGRMFYYLNNGTSTPFEATTVLSSGWQNYSQLAVGDLNGDGHADLLAATSTGELRSFMNTGTTDAPFPTGGVVIGASGWQNFDRIALGDIDGDGRADLIATTTDGRLWFYENHQGSAPFPVGSVIGLGGWHNYPVILMGNVHGVGSGDLIATRPDGSLWYNQNNGSNAPYLGQGNVGLGGWNNFTHIVTGDLGGDGRPDLVATSADGRLWYYPNNGTCQPFDRPFIIGTGGWDNFTNIELADVNGDGKADIVAMDKIGRLWYYPNNGSGTPFISTSIIGSGWLNFRQVMIGDVDGDGKADLIATDSAGRLLYFRNNGSSTPFISSSVIGTSGWQAFSHVTALDVNGDGKTDLLATSSDGRLWYYQNDGSATPYGVPTVIANGWQVYDRLA